MCSFEALFSEKHVLGPQEDLKTPPLAARRTPAAAEGLQSAVWSEMRPLGPLDRDFTGLGSWMTPGDPLHLPTSPPGA